MVLSEVVIAGGELSGINRSPGSYPADTKRRKPPDRIERESSGAFAGYQRRRFLSFARGRAHPRGSTAPAHHPRQGSCHQKADATYLEEIREAALYGEI